MAEEE
jgi:hypothetical protein